MKHGKAYVKLELAFMKEVSALNIKKLVFKNFKTLQDVLGSRLVIISSLDNVASFENEQYGLWVVTQVCSGLQLLPR